METNRREFIAASAVGAAVLALGGDSARAADAAGASLKVVEDANIKIVNDFCAAWDTMDAEKLGAFWDEKIKFHMTETMPAIEGKQALVDGTTQFLAARKKAHFEVVRSYAIGNTVINERIDHFTTDKGDEAFHISGMFLVKNGKIVEWRDYSWPQG